MRRFLRVLVVVLIFLFPTFVRAEIFKWVDEKGTVHLTEDPGTVPEKHTGNGQTRATGSVWGDPSRQLKEDERITYYYRDPKPNELIPILESILKEKDFIPNSKGGKPLVHFFATAVQKDMNKVKDLKTLQQKYSGEAGRLIQTIIEEAKNYHATDLKSPEDLELLWSEYKAAGNRETIERIIKLISRPERSDLDNSAKQMLIKMAPYHYEIYEMLIKKANTSRGLGKILIDDIVSAIRSYAFNPAREHMKRGINYYNLKKYDEALEEYKKSLSYFPDYSLTYCNIASVYDAKERLEGVKGGVEKAIELYKKAISIDPENYTTIYTLGLSYFSLKEYDEAIKCYLKVLEHSPEYGEGYRQLARAYHQKGDLENAAIYYKNFLKYGRQDAFAYAPLIKHYLASFGKPVEEDPDDIVVMFQNKRFEDLDRKLASILRNKTKDEEGNSQISEGLGTLYCNSSFEKLYQLKIKLLKEWLARNPSSYFANACLGGVYIRYAWFARGGGFASTVVDEGFSLFKERLLTAREYLEKAYSLNQSDPYVPALLIEVAKGLGLEREEMEKQFQRAILADPSDKFAYSQKLEYLKEKWHGSEEEMFAFARETAKKAPPGSRLPGILLEAHWEMYFRSYSNVSYFRNPVVWKEMKEVYQTLSHSFPSSKRIPNWFARTAYLAGDNETAREELKKIGDDWLREVWGPKKSFDEVKRELLTK